jgi:HEAT repeat protein
MSRSCVRRRRSIWRLFGSAAVDVLVEALLHDSDWAVREAAADALGEIEDPRAVESLRRAAALWRVVISWRVVRAARRALHRIEAAASG